MYSWPCRALVMSRWKLKYWSHRESGDLPLGSNSSWSVLLKKNRLEGRVFKGQITWFLQLIEDGIQCIELRRLLSLEGSIPCPHTHVCAPRIKAPVRAFNLSIFSVEFQCFWHPFRTYKLNLIKPCAWSFWPALSYRCLHLSCFCVSTSLLRWWRQLSLVLKALHRVPKTCRKWSLVVTKFYF